MIVRGLMVRTTVTETTVMLDVGLMVEVRVINTRFGVASDVTVVWVTYVGGGKLVLRGCGGMVIGRSEDLGSSEEGGR